MILENNMTNSIIQKYLLKESLGLYYLCVKSFRPTDFFMLDHNKEIVYLINYYISNHQCNLNTLYQPHS